MKYSDFIGMDIKDVKKILKDRGIEHQIKYKYSLTKSKGTIIDVYKEDDYLVLVVSKLKLLLFIILFILIGLILLTGIRIIRNISVVQNNENSTDGDFLITSSTTTEEETTKTEDNNDESVSSKVDEEVTTTIEVNTTKKVNKYYYVTFVVDNIIINKIKVAANSTISSMDAPNKEGYSFDGWYVGNSKFNFRYKITSNIKLIAKYNINTFTVTYMDGDNVYSTEVVNYNETAKGVSHPVKNGYKFDGWLLNGSKYDFSSKVTTDITLVSSYVRHNNPTLELNLDNLYVIYNNLNLNDCVTTDAEGVTINFYYVDTEDDNEVHYSLSNIKDITKPGTYYVYATLTNDFGDTAIDYKLVTIKAPTFDIVYSDNKEESHYYNASVIPTVNITNNDYEITDYKLYITEGHYSYTYKSDGNVDTTEIVYDENNYKEVNNLKGYEEGLYQIKMIAHDTRGCEFVYTEPTKIVYSSFDFTKGFTNTTITKTNVNSINFVDGVSIDLENSSNWSDISVDGDNGVIEWWVLNSSGKYDVYVGGNYSHYVESSTSNLGFLFDSYTNLTKLDLTYLSTKNATSMKQMFSNETNLKTIIYGDKWDTSSVNDFSAIFYRDSSMTSFDASKYDLSSARRLYALFAYANNLTDLDLSCWDVSKVTNMGSMFMHLEGIKTLNVSGWDTSNVTDMTYMFYKAYGAAIYEVDMSSWTFKEGINLSNMFDSAQRIKTTMNITNTVGSYSGMFSDGASVYGSGITLNYTSETAVLVNNMINSASTYVYKGTLIS